MMLFGVIMGTFLNSYIAGEDFVSVTCNKRCGLGVIRGTFLNSYIGGEDFVIVTCNKDVVWGNQGHVS